MIALSIRQPWAWLIANGHKDVENRDWTTRYRGLFLIHAGKTRDKGMFDDARWIAEDLGIQIPDMDALDYGGLVGHGVISDCVTAHASPWFFGEFGFLVRDATPLPYIPYRGLLNFFNVPVEILDPDWGVR
ncbi:MAG: ASCH domain-containing protein [Rhodocyclaceae bacterium]|nr:ASCH domain-containing protein [Rhodocyclaceae bacterium]